MKRIIFDAHQDILVHEQNRGKRITQTGFKEILKSPIKLVVASVFILPEKVIGLDIEKQSEIARKQICDYLKIIKKNKKFLLIKNSQDLEKILKTKLTGILLHIEGVDFINQKNLYLIDDFYDLGLRSVGLVWGKDNYIGGYSEGIGGLTKFGKMFIAKLNKKNIIIDLSHANEKTFYDVMKISQQPMMVSHGNCYSLCKNKRNFKNQQLKLLSEREGVQGIFFSSKYVRKKKNILVDDLIDQFLVSYKISPEMVMIGSDFGGISSGFVKDINNVKKFKKIMNLIEIKLGREAVEKISYKNFLNFLKKVI